MINGKRNREISEILKAEFGIEISQAGLDHYRDHNREEIESGQIQRTHKIKQSGYCNLNNRINMYQDLADKIRKSIDKDGDWDGTKQLQLNDLIKVMHEIQALIGEQINQTGSVVLSNGQAAITTIIQIPSLGEDDPINE